ncbi:MAG: diguanylate cyclase, partial [Chloroflexi bacterium]|nr:diguanylate cyclase [Chloroflexota bacterium]
IVDTDPASVLEIQHGLVAQGYQVSAVSQVAPIVARLPFFNVALVSADLPAGDFPALLTALQTQHPETVLICITAQASVETALPALHAHAVAYLTKPLSLDQIVLLVNKALTKQHLDRQRHEIVQRFEQHHAQLERRINELQALAQVAQAITSTLDPAQILDLIVQRVKEVIGGEAVSLLLVDPAQGDMVFHVVSGGQERDILPFRLKIGEGIAGWVAQHGQPVLVPDVRQDSRHYGQADESTGFVTRSILCAPMMVKGQVIGVIEVMNKLDGDFTDGDLQLLTSVALLSAAAIENTRLFQRTQELAITDGLTGLYNYRHFHHLLQTAIDRAQRCHQSLSLIIIDPDHFQEINDTSGNPGGDRVLIALAQLLRQIVRRNDYLARYSGKEFAIILPETSEQTAVRIAERIRHLVELHEFAVSSAYAIRLTVSVGLATGSLDQLETKDDLICRADRAVYRARLQGHNRVCTEHIDTV